MDVDWGPITEICEQRSVALEKNDVRDQLPPDDIGPVEHKDMCWLGKNYADQPDKWKLGCDQGCVKEAVGKTEESVTAAEVFCRIMAVPDPPVTRCPRCLAPLGVCRCEKTMVCDPEG
jgi:hypothetical protein